MKIIDQAAQIPASETFTTDDWRFINATLGVIDRAKSTSWGLPDDQKVVATLLKLWSDAASAAVASDYEEEVAELRNKLKGANMARGRAEKRVKELEELVKELARESD